jgi:CheY-like chemotaxis protein
LLKRTLESQGWAAAAVADGQAALEALSAQAADLILLDLMMPRMDGFEFVSELRKQREWRSIPVIVITAKSLTAEDRLALEGHVLKVIQKGDFTREALLTELREVILECAERVRGKKRPAGKG